MSLAGDFKEILFADLLQFYCLSGQTAAVSVAAPDERGAEATGTFFIDGGALVDARFDGREGAEAVRRAVHRLKRGAFQVELGARSERRTIHEPWRALVLEELRQREAPRPLTLEAPVRVRGSLAPPTRTPTPAAGTRAARGPAVGRLATPVPAPPTEPFPRFQPLLPLPTGRLAQWLLVVGGSLLLGGALAVVAGRLIGAGDETARQTSSAARPSAAPAGVTDTEVVFGMAAPLSGAAKELGRQMKVGLEVALAAANAEGGVHGRRIKLLVLDDGYEPERTREVTRELVEDRGVFGFVGSVGTPTAAVALPVALGRRMLFFGPLTGAPLLRKDPPDRTVFNYRASYLEETAAIVRYLVEVRGLRPDQLAVFAQDDSYGEAGYQGVQRTLLRYPNAGPVLKVTYQRNTTEVNGAVARILERKDRIRAVVMVATYRAAARFIEQVRSQRPQMVFSNVSLVGSQALAEELMQLGPRFAAGVIVTQVVPLPTSRSTAVLRYQEALARYAPGERPDFVSLEGYVVGNLLLEGLRRTGRTVTTENMVRALETIRGLDLGFGTQVAFGPTEHQGSHRIWGTVLDSTGTFQALDLE